jgi:hypothetical protein
MKFSYQESQNRLHIFGVIPADAGIQFNQKVDARLRTSGMTEKEENLWIAFIIQPPPLLIKEGSL